MIPDPGTACVYMLIGGTVTPSLIAYLFAKDRACGCLAEPVPTFVIVIGVLLLWPMLVLLVATQEP